MLCNFQRTKLCKHLLVGGALFAACFGMNSCTDTYDLDTEQPSGLNSIYGYIKDQGKYQYFMRIIEDLGQDTILSKTGSKTLFLADDAAFENFFKTCSWVNDRGEQVRSYDDLNATHKKLLLYSAMIDNPYTTSMLSTAQGPVRGEVCRRVTSQTLYDTVPVLSPDQLPKNSHWETLRQKGQNVVLFKDASAAPPVVHFTPKFLSMHKLESSDVEFLYRLPEGSRNADDVYVGNAKITNPNIFCKNGFIHEVDRVMVPLDNMAELLCKDPKLSEFSKLVERFSAPKDSAGLTNTYNVLKKADLDSVFVKRYFSSSSHGGAFTVDKDGNGSEASLKFDPGWNAYVPTAHNDRNKLMEDMAVILAPTNDAMNKWWNGDGSGAILQSYYGKNLDDVPNVVVAELINNNFLEQITMSLPSKFKESVYDDAQEIMKTSTGEVISPAHIDSVAIGCNGVVFYTNTVFEPSSYRSVYFPAVTNVNTMSVIRTAIEQLDYKAYLNSMVSRYSLFLPKNDAFLTYVDPVSYGQRNRQVWKFYYVDETVEPEEAERIRVDIYNLADVADANGNVDTTLFSKVNPVKTIKDANIKKGNNDDAKMLIDRIEDILDNMIVVGMIEEGKEYYPTKGRSYLKVKVNGRDEKGMPKVESVSGTWQTETNKPISIEEASIHTNGYSYQIEDGVVAGGAKSVVDVLADVEECSEFFNMLIACATETSVPKMVAASSATGRGNLAKVLEPEKVGNESNNKPKVTYLLNGYHYTVYAPDNKAMEEAYALGLPSLADLEAAELLDKEEVNDSLISIGERFSSADSIRAVMLDFVKYHIHDNSVYVDKGFESGNYETAKLEIVREPALDGNGTPTGDTIWAPRRQYKVYVDVSADKMTVMGKANSKPCNVRTELSSKGTPLYNLQAREYWLDGVNNESVSDIEKAQTINTTSSAVVHVIDAPLIYSDGKQKDQYGNYIPSQFVYIRKELAK